jgi:CRP-like cAMP-binding protein
MGASQGLNGEEFRRLPPARDSRYPLRPLPWVRPVMKDAGTTPCNRLLAAIKTSDLHRLELDLQLVCLKAGHVLAEPGEPMQAIWFPETCVVALTVYMEGGSTAQVGILGSDGIVGYPAALGDRQPLARALVQIPGDALYLPLKAMLAIFEASSGFRHLVLRYIGALHAEVLQSAACHALHPAETRLVRLLLMFQDRGRIDGVIPLTHELLAEMLGVQRTTVTAAAGALQRAGLIAYRHGTIEILDRAGLEKAACECYHVIRSHRESLLSGACC